MAKAKKESNTGFRNGDLFCYNCGSSYHIVLPTPIYMSTAIMKQFVENHTNCEKTWEEPKVDQTWTEISKAIWWAMGMNAERGMSSKAMWHQIYNKSFHSILVFALKPGEKTCHPADPDDFRRCYLLLETVPEWKDKLHLMKEVSPVWEKLVDNWDQLTLMLQEQMGTGQPNGMFEFMKKLGC